MGTGDKTALDDLIPLVYDELRKLAAGYLAADPGQIPSGYALVHEAYVRLDQSVSQWSIARNFLGWQLR